MQKSFQPSPDAQVATFDFHTDACLAVKLNMIHFVTGMVRVDDVYLDFATNRLYVSFYFPCTEEAIRSRLINAAYAVKEKETIALTVEQGAMPEAIPA
jgi:hypothetical protein